MKRHLVELVLQNYDLSFYRKIWYTLRRLLSDASFTLFSYWVLLLCKEEHNDIEELSNIMAWLSKDNHFSPHQCQLCSKIVTVWETTDYTSIDLVSLKHFYPILRPLSLRKYRDWIYEQLSQVRQKQSFRLDDLFLDVSNPFSMTEVPCKSKYSAFMSNWFHVECPKTSKYKPRESLEANRQIWRANRDFLLNFDEEEKKKKWHWKRKRSYEDKEVVVKKRVPVNRVLLFK